MMCELLNNFEQCIPDIPVNLACFVVPLKRFFFFHSEEFSSDMIQFFQIYNLFHISLVSCSFIICLTTFLEPLILEMPTDDKFKAFIWTLFVKLYDPSNKMFSSCGGRYTILNLWNASEPHRKNFSMKFYSDCCNLAKELINFCN